MFWENPFADNPNRCLFEWNAEHPTFSVWLFLFKPSSRKEPVYATAYCIGALKVNGHLC